LTTSSIFTLEKNLQLLRARIFPDHMLSTANHSTFCIFEGGALSKQDIDGAFKRGDVIMKNKA